MKGRDQLSDVPAAQQQEPRLTVAGVIAVTDKLAIDERALSESFVRASGPGGQNVNKVASAVQLRLDLAASGLPEQVCARAARLAGKRLTQDGAILIIAQRHRTQERNREDALQRLLDLIHRAAEPPKPRRPTKPTFASKKRRLEAKARRSRIKSGRGANRSWSKGLPYLCASFPGCLQRREAEWKAIRDPVQQSRRVAAHYFPLLTGVR